uniref:Transcriptional regulator n=1 Tax=Strongyloides venezuelensis TaxID=75913 RepID=A0A0K0EUZ3_STRVS
MGKVNYYGYSILTNNGKHLAKCVRYNLSIDRWANIEKVTIGGVIALIISQIKSYDYIGSENLLIICCLFISLVVGGLIYF